MPLLIVQVVIVVDSCALRTPALIREDESRKDLVNVGISFLVPLNWLLHVIKSILTKEVILPNTMLNSR